MKATLFIHKDHEKVQELFRKLDETQPNPRNGKHAVLAELKRELLAHSNVEVELFYPELLKTVSSRAQELVDEAIEDHRKIDRMVSEVAAMDSSDKSFDSKLTELIEFVNQHIEKEEEDVFAEIRQYLSEQRIEELGLELEARKRILTQIAA